MALERQPMTTVTQADIERSRQDTLEHIAKVQAWINVCRNLLETRAEVHDASKLREPELSGFANAKIRLAGAVYGSPEYQALLDESRPIINEHYRVNSHHPEYFENGISGMSLLDVLEMLCDWKAAGERTKDGSIEQSLRVNVKRFGIEPQLAALLWNTAKELGWL
jgi:hypothetical protein